MTLAQTIAVLSPGIRRIPQLANLLEARIVGRWQRCDAVAGWGLRPTAEAARRLAQQRGLPYLALEDGFLRSVGLGVAGYPPVSLVVDDLGIYYDASRPSRLERLIAEMPADEAALAEADRAMALLLRHRLSKYNHAVDSCPPLPSAPRRVLVIDQAAGDLSLAAGGVDASVFPALLQAALAENPDAAVIVKTHPDVLAGKRRGHFDAQHHGDPRISYLAADIHPASLLEQVDAVYVATSQLGFEALLWGKPVVCFGLPWYAGWGVSDDRHPAIAGLGERRPARSLRQLFAAAYLRYPRYLKPESGEVGDVFDAIAYLAEMKRLNAETRGTLYCVGMSWWKRNAVRPFLATPSARLEYVASLRRLQGRKLAADARLVAWSRRRHDGEIAAFARQGGIPVWRMEDGFLRSVGLGSDLLRPLSLVFDERGIYCDPRSPSALEHWLEHGQPDAEALQRAARLRETLARLRMSKYNVGGGFALDPAAAGKPVLLVLGQVESDISIRYGSPAVKTNLGLLEAVRAEAPDAFLVFKPHPDVVAGNRPGQVPPERLAALCDQLAADADIIDCIEQADAVHTLTSLAGFEALLRGKAVHCHGLPFYAGWGLTHDRLATAWRSRRLSLDELVYGSLIHYPRYIDPASLALISAERAVALLEQAKRQAGQRQLERGPWARRWRKLWAYLRVLLGR